MGGGRIGMGGGYGEETWSVEVGREGVVILEVDEGEAVGRLSRGWYALRLGSCLGGCGYQLMRLVANPHTST